MTDKEKLDNLIKAVKDFSRESSKILDQYPAVGRSLQQLYFKLGQAIGNAKSPR